MSFDLFLLNKKYKIDNKPKSKKNVILPKSKVLHKRLISANHVKNNHTLVPTFYIPLPLQILINQYKCTYFNTKKTQMFLIKKFLSSLECQELINIIQNNKLSPSTTVNYLSKLEEDNEYRKSKTLYSVYLKKNKYKLIIHNLEKKVSKIMNIPITHMEPLQLIAYEQGGFFKLHNDILMNEIYLEKGGQRIWTFMIYLNTIQQGGKTNFPKLDIKISPVEGNAIIWNNIDVNGIDNREVDHISEIVKFKPKYVIPIWFRENRCRMD